MDEKKRSLMDVYWSDDRITLDSDWFTRISGGKERAEKHKALLTFDTVEMLFVASGKQFDYRHYSELVEQGDERQAELYMEEHAKDTDLASGDAVFLDDLYWYDDMLEIVDDKQLEVITWKR